MQDAHHAPLPATGLTFSDNVDEAERRAQLLLWLRERQIEEVECIVPDLAGVARGKVMPAVKFADMQPSHLPISIFWQTITGGYGEQGGDDV